MPQPIAAPAAFSRISAAASTPNEASDAGRRGEQAEARGPPLRAGVADQRQQLQRQHRQHAGHQVQDQAAEQREADDGDAPGPLAASAARRRAAA